jgi:hypothetical protein
MAVSTELWRQKISRRWRRFECEYVGDRSGLTVVCACEQFDVFEGGMNHCARNDFGMHAL